MEKAIAGMGVGATLSALLEPAVEHDDTVFGILGF